MNARKSNKYVDKYVDDLLRGRRPKGFAPDDFEAAQMRTAIELSAAGDDEPRADFLDDLHRRLAEQMDDEPAVKASPNWLSFNWLYV